MKLGRRTALDLTCEQQIHFWQAAGVSRFAWNWALDRWNEMHEAAKAEPDQAKRELLWPTTAKLKAEWSEVRRVEFPWSLDVTKCAGTQAIMDLGSTFARAFEERRDAARQGRKPRRMFGFPRFKARNKVVPSFALWNDQIKLCTRHSASGNSYSTINVPNLGTVRLREWVPSMGAILGARVSHRRGRWAIAIQFDLDRNDGEQSDKAILMAVSKLRKNAVLEGMSKEEAAEAFPLVMPDRVKRLLPLHPRPNTVAGHDLGLISTIVSHTENMGQSHTENMGQNDVASVLSQIVPNPRRLNKSDKDKRLRMKRERKLSRSIHKARVAEATRRKLAKGDAAPVTSKDLRTVKLHLSNRQRRQSNRLSKDTGATTDARGDFLHKLSNQVALNAEVNVLEDLHVHGMMANRCLSKSLSDAALGMLGTFIKYKCERAGGLVLWAPRFFPSTKRCSACGTVNTELELSDRSWTCESCGTEHDRDMNAGANLCWLGQVACSDSELSEQDKPWAEWVHEARETVATWRGAKKRSRAFVMADEVGTACPDPIKRGECGERAGRESGSDPHREPRTTHALRSTGPDGQNHICSSSG